MHLIATVPSALLDVITAVERNSQLDVRSLFPTSTTLG